MSCALVCTYLTNLGETAILAIGDCVQPLDTKPRVLLIEASTTSTADALHAAGFEVVSRPSVTAALRELARTPFSLVFVDVRLKSTDGLSVLRQMRARALHTPTCLAFEVLDNASTLEAMSLGAFQCLQRPVDPASLRRLGELALAPAPAAFQSRFRGRGAPTSVSATEAKNEFGRVLDTALRSGAVVITRHESPKAVLLAMDEFDALVGADARELNSLSAEFDDLLARMQTPAARAGLKAAFEAPASELGQAALEAVADGHG